MVFSPFARRCFRMAPCASGGERKMQHSNLRRDESGFTKLGPGEMVAAIMFVFIIAILGAAFTGPLQGQVNNWSANLTANNLSSAATVVSLIPLLFWILLAVGIILIVVAAMLPGKGGLLPSLPVPHPL